MAYGRTCSESGHSKIVLLDTSLLKITIKISTVYGSTSSELVASSVPTKNLYSYVVHNYGAEDKSFIINSFYVHYLVEVCSAIIVLVAPRTTSVFCFSEFIHRNKYMII